LTSNFKNRGREMAIPDYVSKRISRPASLKYIVEGSTPVVCFGDITRAQVVTIGINPSSSEFTKIVNHERVLLTGAERRLSDLQYLKASSTESLSTNQIATIWHDCLNYFDGPYYEKWFSKMQETVVTPARGSYEGRTAAHLDLIQWATDPLWKDMLEIDAVVAQEHLSADFPFLDQQINESSAKFFFLSGSPVIDSLRYKFQLQEVGKTRVEGKRGQNRLYIGNWNDALVLGTTMNIPDSYTSNAHRNYLSSWIERELKNSGLFN
jgi:hypothetical protein